MLTQNERICARVNSKALYNVSAVIIIDYWQEMFETKQQRESHAEEVA